MNPRTLFVLGLVAIPAALLIFIFVKADSVGIDALYWMRWAGAVMACAVPAFLLAGAAVVAIIHAPAEKFKR